MDDKIRQLLSQIGALEEELKTAIHQREVPLFYKIRGKRIEFDAAVSRGHRASRERFHHWLMRAQPPTVLVAPVIYGLIVPLLFLDLGVSIYQAICFPVYKITKVRRADYIAMDRWHLGYLNFVERFNCAYCAYANGVIAFAAEVAGRTEQYWCPIKHAHKVLGTHARYQRFLAFGDGEGYQRRLEEYRKALAGAPSGIEDEPPRSK